MIKSTIHFFNILLIAIIAIVIDYIVYITSIPYSLVSLIVSLIMLVIYFLLFKKGILKTIKNFEILDIIFWAIIIGTAILKISIPDFSYDVSNYHIYLQENIKIDKINFDFYAGNIINGFLFPLGDRMYYLFRFYFGYRLGTILSYYSVIVIFYQTKNILNLFFENNKLISICSILCYSSFILRQWTGTYYIDSLSVIFILEIIYLILKEDILKDKKKLFYIALLSGIATAIKLTNFILIVPLIIFILIKERKNINKKLIIKIPFLVILFIIPFLIYIIDNFIQTGSPIFPYYNNIFKSEYFGNFSWKESRFGIPSIKHALVWPIYVSCIIQGYGDDWLISDYIWGIGFVISILMFIYLIINKDENNYKIFWLTIISLNLTAVWIMFLEGYMRYALIIPVLYSIMIGYIILNLTKNFKLDNILSKSKIFITIFLIIISGFVISNLNINIIENFSMIFKDKNKTIHIDGVWGFYGNNSAITELVREENTPIYNLNSENINTSLKNIEIHNKILQNKDIYFFCNDNDFIEKLKNNGVNIVSVKKYGSDEISYILKQESLILYKIIN